MVKQSRLRVKKGRKRKWALFFVLIVSVIIAGYLQVNKKKGIIAYLNETISAIKTTSPTGNIPRGTVYDRNLKQIAVTLERVSVYARLKEIKSIPQTVKALSAILPLDVARLKGELEAGNLRIWVAENISQEQETAIKKEQLPGIYLQRDQERFYPNDTYAAHLIGYVDDDMGLAGIEYYYDRLLAGKKEAGGAEPAHLTFTQDLVLTVDMKIQRILEDLVADVGGWYNEAKVAAYVMEGVSGEIVGGAQYPGFNPNEFTQYPREILQNLFLQQMVIPDKFRVLLRDSAAIFAVVENRAKQYPWSVGGYKTNLGSQLRLWDWLGITEQWATDFSAYNQIERSNETVYKPFLLSQRQSYGLVPEYATPLKILTAISGIISGKNKIRPHVVAAVTDSTTGEEYHLPGRRSEPAEFADIIESGAGEIGRLLRTQASTGSSGTLFFEDENLVVAPSEKGEKFLSNEMMFVVIPADRSPLTMLVVVERKAEFPLPKQAWQKKSLKKRVGQIVDRISVLQQVGKSVADVVEAEIRGDGNYPFNDNGLKGDEGAGKSKQELKAGGIMPDLTGGSLRKSLLMLQSSNIKVLFQGTGRVVSQTPAPGTSLAGLAECVLYLEKAENMKVEKMTRAGS